MKKMRKSILGITCFLIVLITCLNITSKIFIPKWRNNGDAYMTSSMANFYKEKKDSLDVLFLGDSSVYRGVNPSILWKEQGITSYVYGSPAQRVWLSYYMLKEALRYQKPKVVVIEANELYSGGSAKSGSYRKVFDNMKLGPVKLEAMNDPIFKFGVGSKVSLLFPIFEYHNRYNELTWDDVKYAFGDDKEYNRKGYAINAGFKPYAGKPNYMKKKEGKPAKIGKRTKKYLDKIIDLCEENDIELAILKVPSAADWNEDKNKEVQTLCKNKKLMLLDLNKEMKYTKINWKKDTADQGVHLNLYGAEKVTKEVGDFLYENFNLSKTQDQEVIQAFNQSYDQYESDKQRLIEILKQRKEGRKNAVSQ